MKVFVTGGAGFMGSFFVRLLQKSRDFKIVVIDKLTYAGDLYRLKNCLEDITFYQIDITDYKALEEIFEKERPDFVVHYCAETHVDRSILTPDIFLRTNVLGTGNLLQLSLRYNIKKFINISTDEVYGEIFEGKFSETSPLRPNSPYAVSKASQDMLGQAFFRTYGLPVVTVRPCNNYGPSQYPEKFIPVAVTKVLLGEPIPIYGEGTNVREWLYAEDSAVAVLTILERGSPGEVYNVGSGEERQNIEVAKAILAYFGKDESYLEFIKDRPGHDYRYALNTQKIERELSWKAKTLFEEGLTKTIEWYLTHREWLFQKRNELEDLWTKVYQRKVS